MSNSVYIKDVISKELDLDVSDDQAERFCHFYEMMIEKNKVMNLTRVTDFKEAVQKHFVDSLSIVKCEKLDMNKVNSLIDLGSGAGFPGIPLKIMWPDCYVVMIDSVEKKVNFIREAADNLGLTGIEAVHERAEDLGRKESYREKFDICTSRAVANMSTLSEYCLPFVKRGGYFVAYKSGDSKEEILEAEKAISLLGGKKPELYEFSLFDMRRIMVCVEKANNTSQKYPRKAGIPSRSPIR